MKRNLIFLLAFMWLLLCGKPIVSVAEEAIKENHFVIILDVSGSMKGIDRERQAGDMIARFLNKIPLQQYPIKISVIPFAADADDYATENTQPWCYIAEGTDEAKKEKIKEAVYRLEYNGQFTDINKVLWHCKDILQAMREGVSDCRQVVLFITDGFLDVAQDAQNNKFDNIMHSYHDMLRLADEFPEDCCFLGIMPEIDSVPDDIITYGEDTEGNKIVTSYAGDSVSGQLQYDLLKVPQGLDEFCRRLVARQPAEQIYESRVEKINLGRGQDEEAGGEREDPISLIDKKYEEFFETIFNTDTIEEWNIDLGDGYQFTVPEFIGEVNINVVPTAISLEEKKQKSSQLKQEGMLQIKNEDGESANYLLSSSQSTVNVKLINPAAGNYRIYSPEDIEADVDLKFTSYGNLDLDYENLDLEYPLGSTVVIEGNIVNSEGNAITETSMKNIKIWLRDMGKGTREEVDQVEGNRFNVEYTFDTTGDHYLTFEIEYNDVSPGAETSGVSSFRVIKDPVCISVPEVKNEILPLPEECVAYENIRFVVHPFSEGTEGTMGVCAKDCRTYLGDKWLFRVNEDSYEEMAVTDDGENFYIEKEFTVAGAYTADFYNERTGQILQSEFVVNSVPMRISLPSEEILGNKVAVSVIYPLGADASSECKVSVCDEKDEIIKQDTVLFVDGSAIFSFQPEQSGLYEVTAGVENVDSVAGRIRIVNHVPEKTADFPENIQVDCMLLKDRCRAEIDLGSWFTDPDGHFWRIEFSENDFFEIVPKSVNSKESTLISIARKNEQILHIPRTSAVSFVLKDEYGAEGEKGEIEIEEHIPGRYLRRMGIALIIIVILICFISHCYKNNRIEVKIYYKKYTRKRNILPRELKKRRVSIKGRKIIIIYHDEKIWYWDSGKEYEVKDEEIYLE